MTEREHARQLATKVLDRRSADPDDDLAVLARQFLRAEERLVPAERIVAEQSEDGGIWFIPVYASEALLMQELRKLHAAIEGKSPEQCVLEILKTDNRN